MGATNRYSPLHQETRRRWVGRAIVWTLVLGTLLVLLALRLKQRAHPWELLFERNSGLTADSAYFYADPTQDSGPADLSPDGRYLAVGRPGGDCEIWDLKSGPTLVKSLGLSLPDEPVQYQESPFGKKLPVMEDVIHVKWLTDGKHIAMYRRSSWAIFDLDGKEAVPHELIKDVYECGPSPINATMAFAHDGRMAIADAEAGKVLTLPPVQRVNGGNCRIAYSRAGRYLLLTDLLGLRVWDTAESHRLLYYHRELDFSLPTPNIADSNSGLEALYQRKQAFRETQSTTKPTKQSPENSFFADDDVPPGDFATLIDSQFSPDGSFIATLYQPDNGMFLFRSSGNPAAKQLRFYETSTGRLIWETQLPLDPRAMCFSFDGLKLFVFCCVTNSTAPQCLMSLDVPNRTVLGQISAPDNIGFRPEMTALPGDRLATGFYDIWIVSGSNRFLPFRVGDSKVTHHIKVSPDGSRILVVGADMTARIYRERRPDPVWGILGVPETWGVFALIALLLLGIIWFARPVDAARVSLLPKSLWFAAILGTVGYALDVSSEIIDWCARGIYTEPEKFRWFHVFGYLIHLLAFIAILGMLRLSRRWWILRIVMVMLGTAVVAFSLAAIAYRITQHRSFGEPIDLLPGVRLGTSPAWVLAILLPAVASYGLEIRFLLDRSVRNVMRRAYIGGARGFEVNVADRSDSA